MVKKVILDVDGDDLEDVVEDLMFFLLDEEEEDEMDEDDDDKLLSGGLDMDLDVEE